MNRTKIAFLFAAVFALTFTVEHTSSASFIAVGTLKQSIVGPNPVQKVAGCHTNCRWSFYRAGDGKIYLGCHRNTWSCAFASPCDPRACRWWHWWHK
jgi:hypothetical protein